MLRHLVGSIPGTCVGLWLLAAPACTAQPPPGERLLADLRARDAQLAAGYTLAAGLRVPAHPFDPAQGWEVRSCVLTHDGAQTALRSTSSYPTASVYRRLGEADYQAADFDAASNLLLWRNRSKIGLIAAGTSVARAEVEMLRVTPGGEVVEEEPYTQLYRYPPGSADSLPEVSQILMALGRGFSQRLDGSAEVLAGVSGTLDVRAAGEFGPGLQGEWRLTLAPDTALVRSATFTRAGDTQPLLEVWSEGSIEADGLTLGGRGSVRHLLRAPDSFYEVFVEAVSLAGGADVGLLGEARQEVNGGLPPGAEIVDFTTRPPTRGPGGD